MSYGDDDWSKLHEGKTLGLHRLTDCNFCLQAAGSALAVVDAVMDGSDAKGPKGFAVIRPPGHHATRDFPMGFCLFNNVAIAARYCQHRHHLNKVCHAPPKNTLPPDSRDCTDYWVRVYLAGTALASSMTCGLMTLCTVVERL